MHSAPAWLFTPLPPSPKMSNLSSKPSIDSEYFLVGREMVKVAERDYKNKNGRYGDLSALRKAHFLRNLVFEAGSSADARAKAQANFVPKSTLFQVTVSEDGQHFRAVIGEKCTVSADDRGDEGSECYHCGPLHPLPDLKDSPERTGHSNCRIGLCSVVPDRVFCSRCRYCGKPTLRTSSA